MTSIRTATDRDAPFLPDIERSSGEVVRRWDGLEWIADDDVQSEREHRALIAHGIALVAERQDRGIVGFLNGAIVPDALHIWQMAVHRDWQGRGIGRRLMEAAQRVARDRGADALTLTTFRDVPWNAPFYRKLGFVTLDDDAPNPRLRAVLDAEAQAGLPATRRCAMRKPLIR